MANTVINTPELLNLDSTTGATILAKGTVNERPPTPTFGVDYLVVAGGGGGGGGVTSESPGAGGAGAVIYQAAGLNVIPSGEYTLYIANGGAGGGNNSQGSNGQDSYISFGGSNVVLAKGGGGGGSYSGPGLDGGSGGGGTRDGDTNSSQAGGSAVTTNIAPAGASIYGNNGASGTGSGGSAGGGGGAGEAGNTDGAGTGGDGIQINIDGNNYYWGGGGGAGGSAGTGGQGGGGGGPRGGQGGTGGINPGGSTGSTADGGGNGGANTGGGGGGATNPTGYPGGTGGSGIIILRYPNNFTLVVGAGSLSTGQLNTAIGSDEKYTSFTGGTGTISFSGTVVGGENDATDGALRFNTDTNKTEYFDGTGWYEIVDEYASGFVGPATNYFDTKLYTGNGTTQSIGGYINGTGSFNGSSSLMTITDGGIGANGTARVSFSVSLWIKTTASNQSAIISDFGTNYGFYLQMESSGSGGAGKLSIANFYTGGLVYNTAGTAAINDGSWHHLVLVNNTSDNTQKLYLDGNTTPAIDQTLGTGTKTANAIQVGYYTGYVGTYNFDGSVDQIRFYDTALSASDVAALNLETAATASTAAFPSGQTAVATYTMDTSANGLLTTTDLSTVDYPSGAGCIALYEMNNTTNDTSGTYNGTPANISYQGGAFDQAAVFNGSSSVISLPQPTLSGAFSFSIWVKTTSANFAAIVAMGGTSGNYTSGLNIFVYQNKLYSSWGNGSSEDSFTTVPSTIINTGEWFHLVVTTSGLTNPTVKAYVNGTLGATEVSTQTINTTTYASDFSIGAKKFTTTGASTSYYYTGELDQFRIFNTALTQSQVTTLARGIATSYSGASTDVNFNGHLDFAPDFVWVKNRTVAVNHYLYDSVRGAGPAKALHSNTTDSEASASTYSVNGGIQSIDTNGFTAFAGTDTTYQGTNKSGNDYVSWNWKADGTAVTNNDGNITSQVSANKDSGFSIVKWNGDGTTSQKVGHGLSSAPEIVIMKSISSTSAWYVLTTVISGTNPAYLQLESTAQANSGTFTSTSTTFTNFAYGGDTIAYCWHSVAGYSKIGTYSGTGSNGNAITNVGFQPSFILIKRTDVADNWNIVDDQRGNNGLFPDLASQELSNSGAVVFNTDGFTINGSAGGYNNGSGTYLYMAIE